MASFCIVKEYLRDSQTLQLGELESHRHKGTRKAEKGIING